MQKNKKNKKERHGQPEKLYLVCHLIFIRSNKWQKNCLKINDNGKHKAAISCYMVSPYPMTIPLAHLKECLTRENCQRSLKKNWKFFFSSSYWIAKEGQAFAISESLCKFQSKNDIYTGENKINIMGCRIFLKAISNQSFLTMYDKGHGKL